MEMLEAVKLALAITVDDFDDEISDLIQAALYDLKTNGVDALNMQTDPLIMQAVKTYCRAHFHSPSDYDRLLAAYEEQKGHLMNCTGYTVFPDDVGIEPEPVVPEMDPPDFTLPEGTTVIEEEAFEGNSFQVVKLPSTLISIEARAFADCSKLRQIEIPAGAQIADTAFEGVVGLTIFGWAGSPAEVFSTAHNYTFVNIGG
jgi:hypothetical protein